MSCRSERDEITFHILPVKGRKVWPYFEPHHYLTSTFNGQRSFIVVLDDGTPVGFTSSIVFPHNTVKNARREHRTIVLPDFQGLGLGVRLPEWLGEYHIKQGHRFYSRTRHPRVGAYRDASPRWRKTTSSGKRQPLNGKTASIGWKADTQRIAYSHEYVGLPEGTDLTRS